MGHLATLSDALLACTNTESRACEPYLAEAVAIGDLLKRIAKPTDEDDVIVVFNSMNQTKCTVNWFRSLNGQSLLLSALGLSVGFAEKKHIYWTDAIVRASRQLCRS